MPSEMWVEITSLFPNFNGSTTEVWEGISNFILHFIMDVITNPCWDLELKLNHVSKADHWCFTWKDKTELFSAEITLKLMFFNSMKYCHVIEVVLVLRRNDLTHGYPNKVANILQMIFLN